MIIKESVFVKGSTGPHNCPPPDHPEFAFAGRSNVGKSSLINMLVQKKGLAKTSATPGKTQTINHYLIDQSWYLADLPGYGYAKLSKSQRTQLSGMIHSYLGGRPNLKNVFLLIDSRIKPQAMDQEFIMMLGEAGLPFTLVFTKSEKLGKNVLEDSLRAWKMILESHWEELPGYFVTSSMTRAGRDEILTFIQEIVKETRLAGKGRG